MSHDVFAVLEQGVARETPPPRLLQRILEEASPPRRQRRRPRVALAAAALATAAAAVLLALVQIGSEPPDAEARLAARALDGSAVVYGTEGAGGTLVVDLRRAAAPPAGHHYAVWVLRRGAERMEAVGTFVPRGRSIRLELPLPGAGDYTAVDVSLEEDGGPPSHSGTSVVTGVFRAVASSQRSS
jgi:anti-sigma-K factor RskA